MFSVASRRGAFGGDWCCLVIISALASGCIRLRDVPPYVGGREPCSRSSLPPSGRGESCPPEGRSEAEEARSAWTRLLATATRTRFPPRNPPRAQKHFRGHPPGPAWGQDWRPNGAELVGGEFRQ